MSSRWREYTVEDVLLEVQSGYWGDAETSEDRPRLVRVVRNADITREGLRKSFALRAFSDRECAKASLSIGDIALATSGEVGKAWLVDESGYFVTNFLKKLVVNAELVSPQFFRLLLDGDQLRREIAAHTGGSAIQNLRKSFFSSAQICVPPMTEQLRIVDLVASIDLHVLNLAGQQDRARSLRAGVLADLLERRKSLQDSYDSAANL